jgi:MFS family permease
MVSDASRRHVLTAALLGSSLAPFMVSGLVLALPAIGDEFSADAVSLGWLANVFFLSAAVFLVTLGRIDEPDNFTGSEQVRVSPVPLLNSEQ